MIEERISFTKVINNALKEDETLNDVVPINAENDDIFHALDNGILLCKLINSI